MAQIGVTQDNYRNNADLTAKQDKSWKQVIFISDSTTSFYVPSEAKEIEITALLYWADQNRSLKWLLTENDMFSQVIYNGYYDGQTIVACALNVDGANRIVGSNSFKYGDVLGTPSVRARWR